jgi:hypothetical protein
LRRRLRRVERRLQPPGPSVLDLISTAWVAQGVYTATKLGIIEALRDGPQSADAVAAAVDANPDAVYRLMRLLASRGIFLNNATDGSHSHRWVGLARRRSRFDAGLCVVRR